MTFSRPNYVLTSDKVLSRDEILRLVALCRRSMKAGDLRDPLMIILTLECGLRASELTDLLVGDFSAEYKTILIRSKKGSNQRELPLRASTSGYLKKWILGHFRASNLSQVDPGLRIFNVQYHRFHQIWQNYRPNPRRKIHSLRHSFAVDLYTRSKDIKAVQVALGHRSIHSTQVYIDFHYSQNQLRRIMHGRPRPTRVDSETLMEE